MGLGALRRDKSFYQDEVLIKLLSHHRGILRMQVRLRSDAVRRGSAAKLESGKVRRGGRAVERRRTGEATVTIGGYDIRRKERTGDPTVTIG